MLRKALMYAALALPLLTFAAKVTDDPWPCPECSAPAVQLSVADDPWPCPECAVSPA